MDGTPAEGPPAIIPRQVKEPKNNKTQTTPTSGLPSGGKDSAAGGLKTGVVAGVVVGVAIVVALLASLATFLIMRQVKRNRGRRVLQSQIGHEIPEQRSIGQQGGMTEGKKPLTRIVPIGHPALDEFLPQAADDETVQSKTKTILDQIELFVENFCQAQPNPQANILSTELSTFGSPSLREPLSDLLSQAQDATPFIKHLLANYIVTRISVGTSSEETLLPTEFSLFLNSAIANGRHKTKKAGFTQCLSQWRVLSAFLQPDPSADAVYTADRDRKITHMSHKVLSAFAAWMKTKYNEQDRARSLGVILKEVAGLGMFLFSQPFEMQFQWPSANELGANGLAITPALVKITDEYGGKLGQAQVLVSPVVVEVE